MGNGKSVNSTLYGAFLGGPTRKALTYEANKDGAWDMALVGVGTFLLSIASVWSLFP